MFDLNFEEDDEVYLDKYFKRIKGFRSKKSFSDGSYERSDGWLSIYISCYDPEHEESYKNALEYFVTHQKEVLDALCNGLLKKYPELMEMYGETGFSDDNFPELKNIEDVKKHLTIHTLHIHEKDDDTFAKIGFECECPWDPEHGTGIVMYKDTFINFGSADTAISGWED